MDVIFDLHVGTAWFVGTMSRAGTFEVAPHRYLGVRFAPGGCGRLCAPADMFVDTRRPIDDALPGPEHLHDLASRLAEASGADLGGLLWPALTAWFEGCSDPDTVVAAVDPLVRRSRGRASVSRLAAEVGVSERTLERHYVRSVGLAPKHCLRVERVNTARALVERRDGPPLATIAYKAGYADQAHLTREFRALLGRSPGDWRTSSRLRVGFVQDDGARRT